MRESEYQAKVVRRLRAMFPGCIILRNDPRFIQGIPDLIVLWHNCWAALEVKTSEDAPVQPNQQFYLEEMDKMSFAMFIYPEIEDEVLYDLQRSFESQRQTRFSKSK